MVFISGDPDSRLLLYCQIRMPSLASVYCRNESIKVHWHACKTGLIKVHVHACSSTRNHNLTIKTQTSLAHPYHYPRLNQNPLWSQISNAIKSKEAFIHNMLEYSLKLVTLSFSTLNQVLNIRNKSKWAVLRYTHSLGHHKNEVQSITLSRSTTGLDVCKSSVLRILVLNHSEINLQKVLDNISF